MKLKAKLDFISRFVGVSYFFIKPSSVTRVLRPLQEDESYQYFHDRRELDNVFIFNAMRGW